MVSELWTPPGVTSHEVAPVGHNAETGGKIYNHTFRVHDKATGQKHQFQVLVDDDTSAGHLEEMLGNAMESWLNDVRMRHSKPAPTLVQRKEIGKILDDIRIKAIKRKESTNNKLYYSGLH